MGKKIHDCTCGAFEDSCLDNTKPGEPIFVLRAHDKIAPLAVYAWVREFNYRHEHNQTEATKAKWEEAMLLAKSMERWPDRKVAD